MIVFLVMMLLMMKRMEEKESGGVMPEKYVYRRIEWYCWWIVTPMKGESEGKTKQKKVSGVLKEGTAW